MSKFFEVKKVAFDTPKALLRGQVTMSLIDGLDWSEQAKEKLLFSSSRILEKGMTEARCEKGTTGLVVGYVQSGKTMSFSTVLALAADNGFQLAIVFAGITNPLLRQTSDRLSDELVGEMGENWWCVDVKDNHTNFSISPSSSESPMVIVPVLKRPQRINELREAISNLNIALTTPVLIIDDEADQASFNTLASKNNKDGTDDKSATFDAISKLRSSIGNHIYLQYTATPQAPLLINLTEILSPDWHVVLDAGKGYFGGNTLFHERESQVRVIPREETYHSTENPLTSCPQSLEEALWEFILASTVHLRFRRSSKTISMMVHPEREKDDHKKFYHWIDGLINGWKSQLAGNLSNGLARRIREVYDSYAPQIVDCPTLEEMLPHIPRVMQRISVLLMNSDRQKGDINWKKNRCSILVGGDLLNRGFTVEGLVVTYMPRYSKGKPNADTLQQRARFFGYKSGVEDLVRVHLPADTIYAYESYVNDEEVIRGILQKSKTTKELRQTIVQDPVMRPTRGNILSRRVIQNELTGAKPFKTHSIRDLDHNTQLLYSLIKENEGRLSVFQDFGTADRKHLTCNVGVDDVINLLLELKFSNAKEVGLKTAAIQYLLHWSSQESQIQNVKECSLILMASGETRERKVTRQEESIVIQQLFSGRSTSGDGVYPGDSKIRDTSKLTLQVHRVKTKGFSDGAEFWVPALVFPEELSVHFVSTSEE